MDWLTQKYPSTFAQYYRPRLEYWRAQQAQGRRFYNMTLPMQCQVCQMPMIFTRARRPDAEFAPAKATYSGTTYHFCSDHCQSIFAAEPQKFVQARLLVRQPYEDKGGESGADRGRPDIDPGSHCSQSGEWSPARTIWILRDRSTSAILPPGVCP